MESMPQSHDSKTKHTIGLLTCSVCVPSKNLDESLAPRLTETVGCGTCLVPDCI